MTETRIRGVFLAVGLAAVAAVVVCCDPHPRPVDPPITFTLRDGTKCVVSFPKKQPLVLCAWTEPANNIQWKLGPCPDGSTACTSTKSTGELK